MANPRQRRKARSGSHKAVSHSKSAKKNLKKMPAIRGPKALQEAWDNTKTVSQNYAALGLVQNLNPNLSGGVERPALALSSSAPGASSSAHQSHQPSSTQSGQLPVGHGRIIRDGEGNVIGVELGKEAHDGQEDSDALQAPEISPAVVDKWVTDLGPRQEKPRSGRDVVAALEKISAAPSGGSTTLSIPVTGIPRHSADGEREYLSALQSKYGNDVEKMARDRKLNSSQRTAGELRRALRRAGMIEWQ